MKTSNIALVVLVLLLIVLSLSNNNSSNKETEREIIVDGEKRLTTSKSKKRKSCSHESTNELVKANNLLNQGKLIESKALYEKILVTDSDCVSAIATIGTIYYYLNDFENANKQYNLALEIEPDSSVIIQSKGILYSKFRGNKEGVPFFIKAIDLNPDAHNAHFALGQDYFELKKYNLSKLHLLKFLSLAPNSGRASRAHEILEEISSF